MILITGCKTVEYVTITPTLPTLDILQPERPALIEASDQESLVTNCVRLMTYARQWENYGAAVNEYIERINSIE